MDPLVSQLGQLLRGIWQGRWIGVAVAWLAGLAGAVYIFLTPDRYEATARVYVDTQSILKPLMQGLTVQPNVEQQVALLTRTLISRPNLQKLVRATDMDLKIESPEARESVIDSLSRRLYIRPDAGYENLYTIGFTDTQPQHANRVVQSLLSIFVEAGLSAKSNDTGQAKRFIEEQIKVYEQRLSEAENRLKEFKLKNMDLNAPADGDYFTSIAALRERLREARLLLQEAVMSRDALKQQIADEEDAPPSLTAQAADTRVAATPELDERLKTLHQNLDEMLLRYTDNHPDVMNTRGIIKQVEVQREQERKRQTAELEKRQALASPQSATAAVYPQLKLAFAEAEAQVARLQARVADYEKRHAQLLETARSIPEREAQLTQLNRDYAVQKQNYDALVAAREAALMSSQVEAATGVGNFRIIDPPRVSPNPVAPNRRMLVPLMLLASLCAGVGAAYFFSILRPTFSDNRTLRRIGQRPVLGAVSLISNNTVRAQRRRRAVLFFGCVGCLAATYSAIIATVFIRGIFPF